ncbi:hypothetical protein [uncultured Nostoc sp.]|uniref:hypothetical protein n=1 Tax=uncultured Nostoc sp. TaxID=340711 RepID=UPI0035C95B54
MNQIALSSEHLSISELLGSNGRLLESPPKGWKSPKSITKIPPGTEVYWQSLKSGQWQPGIVEEYWERGAFLEVRCGQKLQKNLDLKT